MPTRLCRPQHDKGCARCWREGARLVHVDCGNGGESAACAHRALHTHNDVAVSTCPERNWHLVSFPATKGVPCNAHNLATANDHSFLSDDRFFRPRAASESRWPSGSRDISWHPPTALWAASSAIGRHLGCILVGIGVGRRLMAAGMGKFLGLRYAGGDKSWAEPLRALRQFRN